MADDWSKKGPPDKSRVKVIEPLALEYSTKTLGTSDGRQPNDTIAKHWESFADAVLPAKSQLQHSEMRKAFYAGAGAMFTLVNEPWDNEDQRIQYMAALEQEINAHFDALADAAVFTGKLKRRPR